MEENENQHGRIRGLKEELAEKDGQLRVAKMNLDTAAKQNQHHMQEVCLEGVWIGMILHLKEIELDVKLSWM